MFAAQFLQDFGSGSKLNDKALSEAPLSDVTRVWLRSTHSTSVFFSLLVFNIQARPHCI